MGGRKPESIVSVQSIAQIRGGIPECVLKPNSQVWGFGVGGASYYRGWALPREKVTVRYIGRKFILDILGYELYLRYYKLERYTKHSRFKKPYSYYSLTLV